jgi:hypothetical protein
MSHLNTSITNNEIEEEKCSLPRQKTSGLDAFTTKFYQTFKELKPMLIKLFHKIKRKGMLLNSFHEASIILITKT